MSWQLSGNFDICLQVSQGETQYTDTPSPRKNQNPPLLCKMPTGKDLVGSLWLHARKGWSRLYLPTQPPPMKCQPENETSLPEVTMSCLVPISSWEGRQPEPDSIPRTREALQWLDATIILNIIFVFENVYIYPMHADHIYPLPPTPPSAPTTSPFQIHVFFFSFLIFVINNWVY